LYIGDAMMGQLLCKPLSEHSKVPPCPTARSTRTGSRARAAGRATAAEHQRGAVRYSREDDLRELLAKADETMYEAKREGRPWVLSQ